MTKIFQVAHRATSLCIVVAQHLFLVVPGVRATKLSSPGSSNHIVAVELDVLLNYMESGHISQHSRNALLNGS